MHSMFISLRVTPLQPVRRYDTEVCVRSDHTAPVLQLGDKFLHRFQRVIVVTRNEVNQFPRIFTSPGEELADSSRRAE